MVCAPSAQSSHFYASIQNERQAAMHRLYNEYSVFNAEALAIDEDIRAALAKILVNHPDEALRDFGGVAVAGVTGFMSERYLRHGLRLRKQK
jgi:hypothetical protein